MYHTIPIDVFQDTLMHQSFSINKIVRNGVLYLDDDTSLNEHSFGCSDDDIWSEWWCCEFNKIVIGKEVTQLPVNLLAEHRYNKNTFVYEIEIDEENQYFTYHEGAIFDKNMYKLVYYTGNDENCFSIPAGVLKIGDYAFGNCHNLQSVVIPDSVTEIGQYAFQNCRSLPLLVVPDGVLTIEEEAFQDVPHVIYKGNADDWCDLHWGAQKYN